MLSTDINNISGLKQSDPGRQQISTSRFFIEKVEWPGFTKQPGSVRIRSAVLAPARASPSAAVTGSAACSFACANLSTAVPVAHPPSSAVLGLAFSRLSPTLLGSAFAPSSTAGLGFIYARTSPADTFWAEIMPGNALSRAVLVPPSLSYKPITSASRDHGNISHDPTRDSSRDPFATCIPRDLSAHDPGNLRPRDPGKITHDLSRNWSSTTSPDKMCFGHASNPLINMWQIMGTINKTRPLNDQRRRDSLGLDPNRDV